VQIVKHWLWWAGSSLKVWTAHSAGVNQRDATAEGVLRVHLAVLIASTSDVQVCAAETGYSRGTLGKGFVAALGVVATPFTKCKVVGCHPDWQRAARPVGTLERNPQVGFVQLHARGLTSVQIDRELAVRVTCIYQSTNALLVQVLVRSGCCCITRGAL
jgi:hypothetical protein